MAAILMAAVLAVVSAGGRAFIGTGMPGMVGSAGMVGPQVRPAAAPAVTPRIQSSAVPGLSCLVLLLALAPGASGAAKARARPGTVVRLVQSRAPAHLLKASFQIPEIQIKALEGIAVQAVTEDISFECPKCPARRLSAARMVGGSRCGRSRSRGTTAAHAQRRQVGAALVERCAKVSLEPSFDPSRVRLKVQMGICAATSVRSERRSEGHSNVRKGLAVLADARIQEKYIVESRRNETICHGFVIQPMR